MSLADALEQAMAAYRTDPVLFVREVFNTEPDEWQKDALMAMLTNKRVGAKACKGPGKTAWLAWSVWWFLMTRKDANVAVTSISEDNLKDGLWKELSYWRGRSPLIEKYFEQSSERIRRIGKAGDTWFCSARSWSKGADSTKQSATLAGLHALSLMFVLDEAGEIPDAVMAAAEAGLSTGGDKLLLMAGNPTSLSGALYRAATKDREYWHLITITGDPDDLKRSPRVSKSWARQQIQQWGRNHTYVKTNVFGEFPDRAANALLGPDDYERATARRYHMGSMDKFSRRIGCDMASETGNDRIVLFPRQGFQVFQPTILRHAASETVANTILLMLREWPDATVFIDRTGGWAAEVPLLLRQAKARVVEVEFGGESPDERYYNMRSFMWMEMADAIKHDLAIPDLPDLAKELVEPQFSHQRGRFLIEPKKDIKKRLMFSPDLADALALTFAQPEIIIPTETQVARGFMGSGKAKSEYQPVVGL